MYSSPPFDEPELPILPALALLARAVDGQSPAVRELFQYALVMLMVEDGQATMIERHVIDAREHLTFRTSQNESFTIIKPAASPARLERIRQMAREVLRERNAEKGGETAEG